MFKIFNGCLVVRLWRSFNKQVELCVFPPFKNIKYHFHKHEDIEVVHIFGKVNYFRIKDYKIRTYAAGFKDIFRSFSVPRMSLHAAKISWTGLVTLSVQKWVNFEVSSVTEDYFEDLKELKII